ncbi:MAG: hypothetical protein COB02_18005 [Candidatus Cloacimonadota bacterium]|nr:MAG: hypothetical protein COB02_18005 [Candidatus Cloacimonadota bacterium]
MRELTEDEAKVDIIYKYVGTENFRTKIFDDRKVRFSSPTVLNDPFELSSKLEELSDDDIRKLYYQNAEKEMENYYDDLTDCEKSKRSLKTYKENGWASYKLNEEKSIKEERPKIQKIAEGSFERVKRVCGILSLSSSDKSLLMWAHYAQNYEGFLVGFDIKNKFFKKDLRPVKYHEHDNLPPYNIMTAITADFLFIKSSEWGYEKEWRMINILKEEKNRCISCDELFEIPASAFKEVIFGCRCKDETISKIVNKIEANPDLKGKIKFFKATLSREKYELNIDSFICF